MQITHSGKNNPMWGKHHSPETLRKISESQKARFGGNPEKHPMFGRTHSPETRAKMSANHADFSGDKSPMKRPEVRAKFSGDKNWTRRPGSREKLIAIANRPEVKAKKSAAMAGEKNHMYGKPSPNLGKILSEETKQKMSDHHADVSGKNNPMYGKLAPSGRGEWFIKSDGSKIWLRSSYEVRVAAKLTSLGIQWQYEPKAFPLAMNGKETTYRPDFYLPEHDLWWEVKGWMRPEAKNKLCCFSETYPEINLKIIGLSDIEKLESGNGLLEIGKEVSK